MIVTGPAAAGKTTALLHVGRACHLAEAARRGGSTQGRVPVAYVLAPPGATAKALATEFARYLGIPFTARMTQAQITEAVCHTYNRAGVRLVLIDEIHRLNPRTTTGAEAVDFLKDLTERIGATFVYAGIDVTVTPLFGGVRGAQLDGRASLVECGAFPARLGTREPFKELIAGVEAALDLHAHRAGTLPRLAPYLHQRTAGRIGSPLPPHPPSRDHRDRGRHRTHHQKPASTGSAWTISPKPGTSRDHARPDGRPPCDPRQNAVTSTNTIRAFRRTGYVQHTRVFSTKPPHPQAKDPTALTQTATKRSQPTSNTPAHTTAHTPTTTPGITQRHTVRGETLAAAIRTCTVSTVPASSSARRRPTTNRRVKARS